MKRLYRIKKNKVFAGVCEGIAEYFNIDPAVVRILWVLVTLANGFGLVAYIIAAIIIPEKKTGMFGDAEAEQNEVKTEQDGVKTEPEKISDKFSINPEKSRFIIGGIVIGIGIILLLKQFFQWIDYRAVIALGIILTGAFVIIKGGRNNI